MRKTQIGRVLAGELILLYQGFKRMGLAPASCRFVPSCSDYAVQAIQRYGLLRGMRQVGARILRCRPGVPGGYDPVN